MTITYKDTKEFNAQELQDLFLSVHWSSGYHPEKLVIAMQNYSTVYSAWDGEKLVGLISVMDDGIMTAYIHYLLVDPDYQYIGFYENCEFKIDKKGIPMHITSLLK